MDFNEIAKKEPVRIPKYKGNTDKNPAVSFCYCVLQL
jgi:hypothetical protein